MNYPRLIIAIATFYVLPVIQLVLLHQTQLTKTGNEDSCYFNFLCMIRSGPFAAFNNIFSNVGYILLGVMFIFVVKKRAYSYTYMRKKYPFIMATHGVPQHFGLFYTMGIGLIMEGILSAAYHVCPSYNNFQLDTSFMYVIGVISTIKLYQCRHLTIPCEMCIRDSYLTWSASSTAKTRHGSWPPIRFFIWASSFASVSSSTICANPNSVNYIITPLIS